MPEHSLSRQSARLLVVANLTALGLLLGIDTASAHITVDPTTAVAGSYLVLTFRVPNESAKAATVGLTIHFPQGHPLASVAVKREPGWTATTTTSKLSTPVSDDDNATITEAVSSITWRAEAGGKITLGQFAEFNVSVGPVPHVPTLQFPVDQSYDDGTVTRWDQPIPATGVEPERPVPTLTVGRSAASPVPALRSSAAVVGSAGTSASLVASVSSSPVTAGPTADPGQAARADNAARTLAVIATVIAACALLVGALGLRRRRSRS